MLLAGDELGRSQGGNNNAYCQDNETSWLDWRLLESNPDLHRFTRLLIAFRKAHPILRRGEFLRGTGTPEHSRPDVSWHGVRVDQPDWGPRSRVLAMHLAGEHAPQPDCDLYLAANASGRALDFELPEPPNGKRWLRVIDTALPSPDDIREEGDEVDLADPTHIHVGAHSCLVLRSCRS